MSLLTDVLQEPTSPTWNINSSLKKQKLLLQNQVPQSKSLLLKSINEFPFWFWFLDVYTSNRSYFDSACPILDTVVKILSNLTL